MQAAVRGLDVPAVPVCGQCPFLVDGFCDRHFHSRKASEIVCFEYPPTPREKELWQLRG